MIITQKILSLFLFSFFSISAFSAEYEITTKVSSPFSHERACSYLKIIDSINEKEKTANPSEKKELENMKSHFGDAYTVLSKWAATVILSIQLPATLAMNTENFSVKGFNKTDIPVFSSRDIFHYMDENGVISLVGSGRISLKLDLKAAAFCPYITDENKTPSVETVLSGLIKN